jgi:asparagine synthase (glutamine-hydrolysing)
MSGIYGIYRYDGAPVSRHWLQCMRSAMAYYGPHGGGERTEGSVTLGHLLLAISPEDVLERQPSAASSGLVVSAARLDNRQELLAAFDIASRDAPQTPDGQLVSQAFDRWGEDVAIHLQGDWAMAAWNRRDRRLFLARDAHGNAALYLHEGRGFVAFASSLKALLALPEVVREPEPLRLAQVLVSWQHNAELTAYKGFRRLVWAQALTIGPNGQSRSWRYWSHLGRDLLDYRHDEDYEEAFLEHYTRAVRSCLRTHKPVAVMLSGGRDSGSVASLAAPLLASQSRELSAYTSIPAFPPDGARNTRLGHEWDQAHATAAMAGANVRHIPVDASEYGVIEGIEHFLNVHDGPSHAAGNHFWIQAIVENVVRNGAGILLTGQMGNATVSWVGNGSVLLQLVERRPRLAWDLFVHGEPNPWLILRQQILKPALTPLRRFVRRLKSPGRQHWRTYSALNPGMAAELDLDARMRAAGYDPTFTFSPLTDHRSMFFRPAWSVGAGLWSEIGAMHGLSILDPTSNLALLEFLLRVPDTQFRRLGQASSLLRRAFRGRLPDDVLAGRRKGLQSADLGHRILNQLPAVQQCIDAIDANPAAREYLDVPRLRKSLQDLMVKVDPQTSADARTILARGMGVGLFLCLLARSADPVGLRFPASRRFESTPVSRTHS